MIIPEPSAAEALLGLKLKNGWEVVEKIGKAPHSTGSFFSVCYKVKKGSEVAFLKAFDFAKFFAISGSTNKVDVMTDMLVAYRYERDLSNHCKEQRVTKVSFVKDSGEEEVTGFTMATVPYLIFDLADGDVRLKLSISDKLDLSWKFTSLHDIAVGLQQLHNIEVTHQDLKPSNVLVFSKEFKLGDIGRSICNTIIGPYNKAMFSGDFTYAPPEILYQSIEKDWHKRVFATDCYLLGSMVMFYFAGISMSAMIRKNIDKKFSWEYWTGTYLEVMPYVLESFSKGLNELETAIPDTFLKKELRWIVECLCNPDIERRGHPKTIAQIGSNFNLERFISKFDILAKKAELSLHK